MLNIAKIGGKIQKTRMSTIKHIYGNNIDKSVCSGGAEGAGASWRRYQLAADHNCCVRE